jgi:hypothetical protein
MSSITHWRHRFVLGACVLALVAAPRVSRAASIEEAVSVLLAKLEPGEYYLSKVETLNEAATTQAPAVESLVKQFLMASTRDLAPELATVGAAQRKRLKLVGDATKAGVKVLELTVSAAGKDAFIRSNFGDSIHYFAPVGVAPKGNVAQPHTSGGNGIQKLAGGKGHVLWMNSTMRADGTPLYGLEVRVSKDKGKTYDPLVITEKGGTAEVTIPPGKRDNPSWFRIKIHNADKSPIGCELLIDGVNSLEFSREFRQSRAWLIWGGSVDGEKTKASAIDGWHSHHSVGHSFVIGQYGQFEGLKSRERDKSGYIWAHFYGIGRVDRAGTQNVRGIGIGDEIYMPLEPAKGHYVDFTKYVGTIAIRYNIGEVAGE